MRISKTAQVFWCIVALFLGFWLWASTPGPEFHAVNFVLRTRSDRTAFQRDRGVSGIWAHQRKDNLALAIEEYADRAIFETVCVSAVEDTGLFLGNLLGDLAGRKRVVKHIIKIANDNNLTNSCGERFDGGESVVFLALPGR